MAAKLPKLGLLCSESPISLAVMREIGAQGVEIVAITREAGSFLSCSRHACSSVTRPEGALASWLPQLCEEHDIEAVIAIGESDLVELTKFKQTAQSFKAFAPNNQALDLVLDKAALLSKAECAGIPVPWSYQPTSSDISEVRNAGVAFPLVAKWSNPLDVLPLLKVWGIEFEKVRYLHSTEELEAFVTDLASLGKWPLLQEYCPGYGLGQMFHVQDGVVTLRFQHRRLREWPLTGGVSSFCEAVPLTEHAELRELSERLLWELKWSGPAMVEYRHDPQTGRSWLMEINGRFWGSLPLATASGVHFAWETYRHAFLAAPHEQRQTEYRRCKARYMAPDLKNLRDVLTGASTLRQKFGFLLRFLGDFLDRSVSYYVFSWNDPMPFLAEARGALKRALLRP